MMTRPDYILALLPDKERGGYTVIVPDLEGCITEGDSFEHALDMANEAIELTLEMLSNREKPMPSTVELAKKKINEKFADVIGNERVIFVLSSTMQSLPTTAV